MIGTVKISQLPTAETLTGSENLIVNQSGDTRLATVNDVIGLVPESGIGIQSSGTLVGSAITTLNFIGAGNTFSVDGSTVNISIQGGGGETYWVSNEAGIHTTSSVGIGTTNPTSELHVVGDINLDDGGTYSTTLQMVTATANRTISFPDATGTVALVAGSSGQLTYNNAGSLAGAPTLTYDGSILTSSGRFINSYNATASSPAKVFTGSWFTGGTSTTTKPQVLIEPTGTTSTAWSTNGTGLGVNAASGFSGNLLDLQVNGTRQANVASNGDTQFGAFGTQAYAGGFIVITNTAGNAYSGYWGNDKLQVAPTMGIGWGSFVGYDSPSLTLFRDAADTLAQRNTTNAQTFRLYNTYTDGSNYERHTHSWSGNVLNIANEAAGSGTLRGIAFSQNGAASTPPAAFTGSWFTGGTSTTTKPQLLIEPSGTTSTAWSTNGTGLGVNAPSGFGGKLLDLQVNGTSQFAVDASGATGVTCVRLQAANRIDANNSIYVGTGTILGNGYLGLGSAGTPDTIFARDAANIFAQRNGTNAQTFRLYNTYTDASNYERHTHSWSGNVLNIANEAAGSGTLRGIAFGQNGTDSTPPVTFTGSWFTGGTATTTKPQLLIEPSGTTSTAWSTNGTGLGVNAPSGFAGNLLDLQVNGTSKFRVDRLGHAYTNDMYAAAYFGTFGKSIFNSPSDGVMLVTNYAVTDFNRLQFGGTSASFPALKRSTTTLQARLADDSGYTTIDAQLRAQGTAPAATGSTGTAGDIRYDADYIYICTATNTWKRAALSTW